MNKFLSNRSYIFGLLAGWISLGLLLMISGTSGRSVGADAAGFSCNDAVSQINRAIVTNGSLGTVSDIVDASGPSCGTQVSYCTGLYDQAKKVESWVYDDGNQAWYDMLSVLAYGYKTYCGIYASQTN